MKIAFTVAEGLSLTFENPDELNTFLRCVEVAFAVAEGLSLTFENPDELNTFLRCVEGYTMVPVDKTLEAADILSIGNWFTRITVIMRESLMGNG